MTSPADETEQEAAAAEAEAPDGGDAGGGDEQDDLAAECESIVGEGEEGEGEVGAMGLRYG